MIVSIVALLWQLTQTTKNLASMATLPLQYQLLITDDSHVILEQAANH